MCAIALWLRMPLISTHGRNTGHAIERREDSATKFDIFISIQFPMGMIEQFFFFFFDWAVFKHIYLSFCEQGKKKKSPQNLRRKAVFIVITEYGLWISRNLCSNPSPATYLLNETSLSLSKPKYIQLQNGINNISTRKLWVEWGNFW